VGRAACQGGLVVPPGDRVALCQAIRRLLDDPQLRERLGASGRAYAEANWQREVVLSRAASELQSAIP
jgi:colanic acid biosynthesis glycosyl transferase WcaI